MHNRLDCDLIHKGAFTMANIKLAHGETVKAEAGSMVAMTNTIDLKGRIDGGVFRAFSRRLSGEKFFFQQMTATRGAGEVLLAPVMPGDLSILNLDSSVSYCIQKSGFFAASESIELSTKMQNVAKGLFTGEGFFILKARGTGTLIVSSYGGIHSIDIPEGKDIIVDNHHLVAWPESTKFSIELASSNWISSLTSGEGLVCRFRGPGKIYVQTRNPYNFSRWLNQINSPKAR